METKPQSIGIGGKVTPGNAPLNGEGAWSGVTLVAGAVKTARPSSGRKVEHGTTGERTSGVQITCSPGSTGRSMPIPTLSSHTHDAVPGFCGACRANGSPIVMSYPKDQIFMMDEDIDWD
jgi:hypothetical protein